MCPRVKSMFCRIDCMWCPTSLGVRLSSDELVHQTTLCCIIETENAERFMKIPHHVCGLSDSNLDELEGTWTRDAHASPRSRICFCNYLWTPIKPFVIMQQMEKVWLAFTFFISIREKLEENLIFIIRGKKFSWVNNFLCFAEKYILCIFILVNLLCDLHDFPFWLSVKLHKNSSAKSGMENGLKI